MSSSILRFQQPEKDVIRSKVRFHGDYRQELKKLLEMADMIFEKELPLHVSLDSIATGNNEIKIRINDVEKMITRMVTCSFRHHHDDVKYGRIYVELTMTEVSMKPRSHFVGQFSILDQKKICEKLLKDVLRSITMV